MKSSQIARIYCETMNETDFGLRSGFVYGGRFNQSPSHDDPRAQDVDKESKLVELLLSKPYTRVQFTRRQRAVGSGAAVE